MPKGANRLKGQIMKHGLKREKLLAVGMFPVLTGEHSQHEGVCIPLSLIVSHENQCQRNHGQSIQRLAERGGLSPCEIVAIIEDREWKPMQEHDAWKFIFQSVK